MRAARIDVQGISGPARRHEQPIPLGTAEAYIRTCFGQPYLANACTVGRQNVHTIISRPSPPGRRPHIAVDVDAQTVWPDAHAFQPHVRKLPTLGQSRSIAYVVDLDVARGARVDD